MEHFAGGSFRAVGYRDLCEADSEVVPRRMHTFRYRLPRFTTSFPVEFLVGEVNVLGRCTDISEAGLRGVFRQPMPVGTMGLLTLNRAPWRVEVNARVAYLSSEQMVLRFTAGSSYERVKLRQFMQAFSG